MPDLAVLGDCPVELWCRGRFTPDIPFRSRVGGDSFALARAAATRGIRTGLVTRLGDDLFEPYIRREMEHPGIDLSRCLTGPGTNGVILSTGDRRALQRSYRRAGSAAAGFNLLDPDAAFIQASRWFCATADFQALSGPAQEGVSAAFRVASEAGVRTAFVTNFDPRLREPAHARAALVDIAPLVEVAFVDVAHVAAWLDMEDPARIAAWLLAQGIRIAVVRGGGAVRAVATPTGGETVIAEPGVDPRAGADNAELDASFLHDLGAGADPVSAAHAARRNESDTPLNPKPDSPDGTDRAVVHIDGGSRGNPGVAGAGVYFEVDGKPWRGLYEYLGLQTNNFAEYSALLAALRYALGHGLRRLSVCSDSELLVKQLKGIYRVKNPALRKLHEEAEQLIRRFERFSIRHVPREQNTKADALANRAQDERDRGEESYA